MNILKQMTVANNILSRLEVVDPTCIVAGGAPRDWSFNHLASDIDVFFFWRPDLQNHHYEKMLSKLSLPNKQREFRGDNEMYEYVRNPNLKAVYEGMVHGVKVQLMSMTAPTFHGVIDHFPLDICKVWYKNGEIHTTKEFDIAKERKILKVTNALYAHGDAYIRKIKNKFPDFLFLE